MEFKLLFLVFCAFLFLDVAISSREFDEGEDDLNQQQQQTEDDEGLIQFQRNLNPGPSILARSQIPEVVDACLEPKRTGRCKAHVPRYWFNSVSGQCERFTFGGCGGNGNNFEDITACEQRCSGHLKKALKPEQIDGDDDEICAQPPYDTSKSNSSCRAYLPRWFYNATTETCETFIYKGCGATQNLYRNKNLCQAKCGHYRLPKAIDSNPESQDLTARVRSKACELPMNPGPCFAINNRFYYNKENGRCQAFVYGGCGGNGNNFQTDEECSRSCGGATPSYNTGCAKISCPWHMYTHYTSMDCKPIYDGQACCPTRFDCPSDMNQTTTTSTLKAQPTCKYNGKVYQIGEKIPEASSNSACRAACNCYESEGKARINCVSIECPEDFGAVPAGKENCTRLYEKDVCCATGYHCPSEQQPAPAFTCQYEGNTYVEGERIKLPRGQCQNCLCQRGFNGTLTSQFCEPIDCGIEIYYSEQLSRGCSPVYFRSTDGSEGCCPIGWECPDEQDLSLTQPPVSSKSLIQQPAPAPGTDRTVTVAVCSLKADSGPCRASRPRFFFNSTSNKCERFIYGGCEGNGNNFAVLKDCETICAANSRNADNLNARSPLVRAGSIPSLPSKTYELTELDACTQPPKKGICRGYFPRYYFSPDENQCKFFIYGGCRGNKNNFHSLEACAAVCQNIVSSPQNNLIRLSNNANDDEIDNSGDSSRVNFDDQKPLPDLSHSEVVDITNESRGAGVSTVEIDEEDPCTPKPETGRCKGHIRRYYYDSEAQYCKQFVYGGCGGNRNNFERLKECDIRCSPNKGQGLPGPGNVRAQIRWRSMAVGVPKPEESNRTQAVFGGYLERCNLPLQVGSCKATMKAYYYDVEAQECLNFTYSGCFGNANRFTSLAECQATCTSNKQSEGTTTTSSPVFSRSGNLPRVRVQDIPSGRRERPEKHVVEEVQEDKEFCSLPATPGNCRGHNLRYYFNSDLSQCLPFVYSGCRGNQNNFLAESDCISACSKEPTIEALTQEGVLTCSFGNETIPIGGKLGGNPGEEPCGVPICQCLTPPSLTCIQVQCPPPPPPQASPPPCPTPNCGPLCKPSIRPDNGCPTCDCEAGSEFQSVEFVTPNGKCQGAGCPSPVKNVKG